MCPALQWFFSTFTLWPWLVSLSNVIFNISITKKVVIKDESVCLSVSFSKMDSKNTLCWILTSRFSDRSQRKSSQLLFELRAKVLMSPIYLRCRTVKNYRVSFWAVYWVANWMSRILSELQFLWKFEWVAFKQKTDEVQFDCNIERVTNWVEFNLTEWEEIIDSRKQLLHIIT